MTWTRINLILVVLFVAIGAACTRKFKPQKACGFVVNSELQRVSWQRNTPVKLYVNQSVPVDKYPDLELIIRQAVNEWNTAIGHKVLSIAAFDVGGPDTPRKDGYSTIYWMHTWDPSRSDEQARTTIYWTGSRIYEADIRINARYHTFYVGEGSPTDGVDFKSLILHELGHVLGLAHVTNPHSVMQPDLALDQSRRILGQIDVNDVQCQYH